MTRFTYSAIFLASTSLITVGIVLSIPRDTVMGASSPTVSSITAAATEGGSETSLTLTENTTTPLYVHGLITDPDGCADVATNGSVTGKFYRSNHASGDGCSVDNNDCYTIADISCTKTGCDGTPEDTTLTYACSIPIQYYADTTMSGPHAGSDWTAKIIATDASTATGNATDAIEMNTTVALGIPPTINYGVISLGVEGAEQTLPITNTGNSRIDTDLSVSGNMSCLEGTVPAANVRYSMTQGFEYTSGTALSTAATELETNLVSRADDTTESIKNIYLKLKMPAPSEAGIRGACSNTLTVTAKADTESGW